MISGRCIRLALETMCFHKNGRDDSLSVTPEHPLCVWSIHALFFMRMKKWREAWVTGTECECVSSMFPVLVSCVSSLSLKWNWKVEFSLLSILIHLETWWMYRATPSPLIRHPLPNRAHRATLQKALLESSVTASFGVSVYVTLREDPVERNERKSEWETDHGLSL